MKLSGTAVIYGLVALVLIGGSLLTVVFILGGSPEVVTTRAAIITGFMAPTIGVFVLVLQQSRLQDQVQETKDSVNGHLQVHVDQAADAVKSFIDQRVKELQIQPLSPTPPSPDPPAGGNE